VHPHHAGERVAVGDADGVVTLAERRQRQLDRVQAERERPKHQCVGIRGAAQE